MGVGLRGFRLHRVLGLQGLGLGFMGFLVWGL